MNKIALTSFLILGLITASQATLAEEGTTAKKVGSVQLTCPTTDVVQWHHSGGSPYEMKTWWFIPGEGFDTQLKWGSSIGRPTTSISYMALHGGRGNYQWGCVYNLHSGAQAVYQNLHYQHCVLVPNVQNPEFVFCQ
jgi:hypothetical protein